MTTLLPIVGPNFFFLWILIFGGIYGYFEEWARIRRMAGVTLLFLTIVQLPFISYFYILGPLNMYSNAITNLVSLWFVGSISILLAEQKMRKSLDANLVSMEGQKG